MQPKICLKLRYLTKRSSIDVEGRGVQMGTDTPGRTNTLFSILRTCF